MAVEDVLALHGAQNVNKVRWGCLHSTSCKAWCGCASARAGQGRCTARRTDSCATGAYIRRLGIGQCAQWKSAACLERCCGASDHLLHLQPHFKSHSCIPPSALLMPQSTPEAIDEYARKLIAEHSLEVRGAATAALWDLQPAATAAAAAAAQPVTSPPGRSGAPHVAIRCCLLCRRCCCSVPPAAPLAAHSMLHPSFSFVPLCFPLVSHRRTTSTLWIWAPCSACTAPGARPCRACTPTTRCVHCMFIVCCCRCLGAAACCWGEAMPRVHPFNAVRAWPGAVAGLQHAPLLGTICALRAIPSHPLPTQRPAPLPCYAGQVQPRRGGAEHAGRAGRRL